MGTRYLYACVLQVTPLLPKSQLLPPLVGTPFMHSSVMTSSILPLPLPFSSSQKSHNLFPHATAVLPDLFTSSSHTASCSSADNGDGVLGCGGGPVRRRISDKCNLPVSAGM